MYCYILMPLDLHVLGLSLAFILSQDQTLLCISFFILSSLFSVALIILWLPKGLTYYTLVINAFISIFLKNSSLFLLRLILLHSSFVVFVSPSKRVQR